MLNVSSNKLTGKMPFESFKSLSMTIPANESRKRVRILLWIFLVLLLFMFLPWTQTIRSKGMVNALRQDQRPQTIQTVIAGRIEGWYVAEGDFVQRGDTLLLISEIKDDYFDPLLIERTVRQVEAKNLSANSYGEKVKAQQMQMEALRANNILRKEQAENRLRMTELKVISDSIRFEQAKVNFEIGQDQVARAERLFEEGLRSLVDLETRRLRFQEVQANLIAAENTLLSSQNERIAATIELNAIDNDFRDRLAKTQADMFTAMSSQFDAEATATKLENQLSNYEVRSGMRYILAPQDGFIARALQVGLGETVSEGTEMLSIMPANATLAVEMYVDPIDLPLVRIGNRVRFIFDGWPAIVFSGWPQISNGTFGGKVVAIDKFTGPNNKYRVVVAQDPDEVPWPEGLQIGSAADGIALLNDVPIWYEIWRQLNGFPADFYTQEEKRNVAGK
jgi:multidrug resistance efflux pump